MATILYVPTCMPSGGDGEPLIICVVAGSGISWDCDIKDFDKVAAGEKVCIWYVRGCESWNTPEIVMSTVVPDGEQPKELTASYVYVTE